MGSWPKTEFVECGFDPSEQRLPLETEEPSKSEIETLEQLGFERVGVKWETVGPERRTTRSVSFASNAHRCFADWARYDDGTLLFFAFTAFEDGTIVLTSRGGPWHSVRTSTAVQTNLNTGDIGRVLDAHASEVRMLEQAGHAPLSPMNQEARLRATHAYYANAAFRFADYVQQTIARKKANDLAKYTELGMLAVIAARLAAGHRSEFFNATVALIAMGILLTWSEWTWRMSRDQGHVAWDWVGRLAAWLVVLALVFLS